MDQRDIVGESRGAMGRGMAGTRVRLRLLRPADVDFLYELSLDPGQSFRWRFRGNTPSPQSFASGLWEGVLAQFVVDSHDGMGSTPSSLGAVIAYQASIRDGWCYVGALGKGAVDARGRMAEAMALFLDYLFDTWPFRWVYLEVPEYTFTSISSGSGRYFEPVARFPDHFSFRGRYWDLMVLAVTRERWRDVRPLSWLDESREEIESEGRVMPEVGGLDDFCTLMAQEFPNHGVFEPDSRLVADMGLDSLDMANMFGLIQELSGLVEMDLSDLERLVTVRDAYLWYCTASSAPLRSGME